MSNEDYLPGPKPTGAAQYTPKFEGEKIYFTPGDGQTLDTMQNDFKNARIPFTVEGDSVVVDNPKPTEAQWAERHLAPKNV